MGYGVARDKVKEVDEQYKVSETATIWTAAAGAALKGFDESYGISATAGSATAATRSWLGGWTEVRPLLPFFGALVLLEFCNSQGASSYARNPSPLRR